MFLTSHGEGITVDTGIRVSGVVLVRLDEIEVTSFTFGEAIVAVELKFGRDNRVFTGIKDTEVGTKVAHEEVAVGKAAKSTVTRSGPLGRSSSSWVNKSSFRSDRVAGCVAFTSLVTTSSRVVSVGGLA